MFRFLLIIFLLVLTGCDRSSSLKPKTSVYEITGSGTERITNVSNIIAKHHALPTTLLDAHFVEEKIGDGVLGPSDFRAFYFIKVAPQDVAQWTSILSPLDNVSEYTAPIRAYDWWVSHDAFKSLQFYKPFPLTGRVNGWIGVAEETGYIYIFTFTT